MTITGFYSANHINQIKKQERRVKQHIKSKINVTSTYLLSCAPLIKISDSYFYNPDTHTVQNLSKHINDNMLNTPAFIWDANKQAYIQYFGELNHRMTINDCNWLEKPFFIIGNKLQEAVPVLKYFSSVELNPVQLGKTIFFVCGFIIVGAILSTEQMREKMRTYFQSNNSIDADILNNNGDTALAKIIVVGGISMIFLIMNI